MTPACAGRTSHAVGGARQALFSGRALAVVHAVYLHCALALSACKGGLSESASPWNWLDGGRWLCALPGVRQHHMLKLNCSKLSARVADVGRTLAPLRPSGNRILGSAIVWLVPTALLGCSCRDLLLSCFLLWAAGCVRQYTGEPL